MSNYKLKIIGLLASLLSMNSTLIAKTIPFPETQFATIETCKSCHGEDGLGVPNFTPMLVGLTEEYLEQQIKLYQTGMRTNLMMTPMSQKVDNPKLRQAILSHFASLPAPKITTVVQRGDQVIFDDPIERLVYQGDWERSIPACASCHGQVEQVSQPFLV